MKARTIKKMVIAAMLTMLTLAFSGCNEKPEESSTAEAVTTTATTEMTAETTTTAKTTTEKKTETTVTTTTLTTTAPEATTKAPSQQQTQAQAEQLSQKTTTAKPAAKPTPTKATTAAPTGHYETVHHDAVTQQVWVQDRAASTKRVYKCYCGQMFNSYDEYTAHSDQYDGIDSINNGDFDKHCGYQFWDEETPATGHYETQTITAAYDEQVWVRG